MKRFGQYLVENDVVDECTMIQALSIQRRRNLIPIGEIALQKQLLTAKELFHILNSQDNTGDKFGTTALKLGLLTQDQLTLLLKLQKTIHVTIGSILVELRKVDQPTIDAAWKAYTVECQQPAQPAQPEQPEQPPFEYFTEECPVCKHKAKQRLIDTSLYTITQYDYDTKPSKLEWDNAEYAHTNRLISEVWSCPECGFSALYDYFRSPTSELSMSPYNFAKKVKKACADNSILEFIQNYKIPEQLGYAQSIKCLFASIYIFENIPAIADKDALILANHYRQLAWLYRDITSCTDQESKAIHAFIQAIKEVNEMLPDTEEAALTKALTNYEKTFFDSTFIETKGTEHIIQQMMGRVNIQNKDIEEGEKLLQEASKTAEYKIKTINDTLDVPGITDENKSQLLLKKGFLSGFLMETIEIFQRLGSVDV